MVFKELNTTSEFDAADIPMPDVPGAALVPSQVAEAALNNKDVKTCVVRSNWVPTDLPNVGSEDVHFIAVRKGQEGFTIGDVHRDKLGGEWRNFALARSKTIGWVKASLLEIGQNAQPRAKVIDLSTSIPEIKEYSNQGSVLQRTVSTLYSDIVAAEPQLAKVGADLDKIRYLRAKGSRAATLFLNGRSSRKVLLGAVY